MEDETVIVCISDNGPGINPELRSRLFERHAMARAIERKVGSGLGLYLSKQIIEAHNGEIWYTTEVGIGSTFCFRLPIS
jgi:signal transduction histidine kinase